MTDKDAEIEKLLDDARNEGAAGAFGAAVHVASVALRSNTVCSHGMGNDEIDICDGCEYDWEQRVSALPKDIAALTPADATAWLAERLRQERLSVLREVEDYYGEVEDYYGSDDMALWLDRWIHREQEAQLSRPKEPK